MSQRDPRGCSTHEPTDTPHTPLVSSTPPSVANEDAAAATVPGRTTRQCRQNLREVRATYSAGEPVWLGDRLVKDPEYTVEAWCTVYVEGRSRKPKGGRGAASTPKSG